MISPSILGQLRAIQEQALTETVLVERVTRGPLGEDGKHPVVREKVWEGPAAVVSNSTSEVDAAGRLLVHTGLQVNLPVNGTGHVHPGHEATITGSTTVTDLVGTRVTLTGHALGGWRTLRRFTAEEGSQHDRS